MKKWDWVGDKSIGDREGGVLICLQIYFNRYGIIFLQLDQSFPDASDF